MVSLSRSFGGDTPKLFRERAPIWILNNNKKARVVEHNGIK